MSSVTLAKRLHVRAPPADVWTVLTQPSAVVTCLPGATLLESSEDGQSHTGTISVNLGPLSILYRGTLQFVEIDHGAQLLRVSIRGRENTGGGTVSMSMVAGVAAAADGSDIDLSAKIQLAGRVVSLGRGIVEAVAEETLAVFASCLTQKLDAGERQAPGEASSKPASPRSVAGLFGVLVRAIRSWLRRPFVSR